MELGLKKNTVKIAHYDLEWKNCFLKEKEILEKQLSNYDVDIEHVGSTAIVGCAAKPIIDIAIGVPHLEYGKKLIPLLEKLGWIYTGKSDFGVRWFLKKCNGDVQTHFLHIEGRNTRIWQNHIIFRDYMNLHPEKVAEYSKLKKELEVEFANDREGYIKRKKPFIDKIIKEALDEFNVEAIGEDYKLE